MQKVIKHATDSKTLFNVRVISQ